MAIVNVSLDTNTRQMVLTINGIMVPATDISMSRFIFSDGEVSTSFEYTIEGTDGNGIKERRQFFLPSLDELATVAHTGLDDRGLASKVVHDDNKAKADVIDFLSKEKKSD